MLDLSVLPLQDGKTKACEVVGCHMAVPKPDKVSELLVEAQNLPWPCLSHHPMALCDMICAQGRGGNSGFPFFLRVISKAL